MKKVLLLLIVLCFSNTLFAQLKLTSPNGGEVFVAGSDTIITWEGCAPDDSVDIEFSSDAGATWETIITDATNFSAVWNKLPLINSDNCLIKAVMAQQDSESIIYKARHIKTLRGSKQPIRSISWCGNEKQIVGAGAVTLSGEIKVWDIETEQEQAHVFDETDRVPYVAWSPNGKWIAVGGGKDVKVYDATNDSIIFIVPGRSMAVAWHPHTNLLATQSLDYYCIDIWNIETGQKIMSTSYSNKTGIGDMTWCPDGNRIIVAYSFRWILVVDTNTGDILLEIDNSNQHMNAMSVNSLSVTPDGSKFAYIPDWQDGVSIAIYDSETGQILTTIASSDTSSDKSSCQAQAWSPDGKLIAYGADYKCIYLWDTERQMVIDTLIGHEDVITDLEWSKTGQYLASGSRDSTIKIWQMSENSKFSDVSDAVFSIVMPEVNAKEIDFGKRLVGSVTDSVVADFVYNPGTYKNRIDSIYIRGEHVQAFSLIAGFPKYYVEAGAGHVAEFRFEPYFVGQHRAEIVIITQTDTLIQNIIGEGFSYDIDSLRLHAGDISAYDDRIIHIPIILDSMEKVKLSGITAISADLQYNSTLLYPNYKYERTAISPTIGQITLSDLPIDQAEGDTLIRVMFKTGLGNAEGCDLVLLNPVLTGGGTPEVITEDGYFSLLGVCHEGGARLFSASKIASGIHAIRPNPASNYVSIDIGIIEKGYTEVAIYDVLGKKIKTVFAEEVAELGERTISADLSDIGNGQYMLLFKSPTYVEQKAVMVWK